MALVEKIFEVGVSDCKFAKALTKFENWDETMFFEVAAFKGYKGRTLQVYHPETIASNPRLYWSREAHFYITKVDKSHLSLLFEPRTAPELESVTLEDLRPYLISFKDKVNLTMRNMINRLSERFVRGHSS